MIVFDHCEDKLEAIAGPPHISHPYFLQALYEQNNQLLFTRRQA